jgi:hypothetical protein
MKSMHWKIEFEKSKNWKIEIENKLEDGKNNTFINLIFKR